MANFIFIHGTGGNPDEWFFPWLRKELEKRKHKVYAPFFPTPTGQTLENWMKEFEPYRKHVNKETVFVGRSIGSVFILRLLEKTKIPVKGAFLVAGFCSKLGLQEFEPLIETFIEKPLNWKKIRSNCGCFFVYHSDNDPIVSLQKGEELAEHLGVDVTLVRGAKHFWLTKLPKLLDDIKRI